MKGVSVVFLLLIASAFSFGQSMMSTSNSNGNSTSMMSANPMKADTRVGNQLRYAPSSGTKVIFTTLKAAEALAAKHPTVLFFAADWCPYCQADLRDINANGDKLGDVAIVVADYDKTAVLKAKYGITVQDTFVQIDANGKQKAVWAGGGVDGILSHIVRS
jgi:thiol-disulfide isomerase/thioredoxin